MTRTSWLLASLFVIGCGGPSEPSIDRSTPITALSAQQRQDFCAWEIAAEGGAGASHDCGNGVKVGPPEMDTCTTTLGSLPAACSSVTYGELKDCADAGVHDLCSADNSAACAKVLAELNACAPQTQDGGMSRVLVPTMAR